MNNPASPRGPRGVHVDIWGDGVPVVLVHGSLATGAAEWEAQRPLGDGGYRLIVPDRRGYGRSAPAPGEDFLADAEDIAELLGPGAHLVGHSYGGLGAMIAAARRPKATLSLTLLEAPSVTCGGRHPAWQALVRDIRSSWYDDVPDLDWVMSFLKAVGSDPDDFPPEMLDEAEALTPVFRKGRPFYEADLPLDTLRKSRFPKLVVSGGHHAGFDAMCADLAGRIGAAHRVVEGAGHEIQFTGSALNEVLVTLWQDGRVARSGGEGGI